MYAFPSTWLAIVAGGVAGWLGLWLAQVAFGSMPLRAHGRIAWKLLPAVLFMVPVPAILDIAGRSGILFEPALAIALVWLVIAHGAAAKLLPGPKDAPWGSTLGLAVIQGVIALAVYYYVLFATITV